MELAQWIVRIALAITFAVMGISHFVPSVTRTMAAMIPPPIRFRFPSPKQLVWFTGVCELAGAVGILVPWTRLAAGICLIVFLIVVFPANAYAARHPERFGRAAFPFWPRLVAQVVLIAAVVFAVL
jgi:uncharacterized membrane protein